MNEDPDKNRARRQDPAYNWLKAWFLENFQFDKNIGNARHCWGGLIFG